ncbi:MAG TPA: hypothetical protein VGB42_05470 [Candidatus Thermoplasmatota archaeon]
MGQLQRQSVELLKQLAVERQRNRAGAGGDGPASATRRRPAERGGRRRAGAATVVEAPEHLADLDVGDLDDATMEVLFANWMEARSELIRDRLEEHGDVARHVGEIARAAEADAQREALASTQKMLGVEIQLRQHAEEAADRAQRELESAQAELAREVARSILATQELDRKESELGAVEVELAAVRAEAERLGERATREERARHEVVKLCEDARLALGAKEAMVDELQETLQAAQAESQERGDRLVEAMAAREAAEGSLRSARRELEVAELRLEETERGAAELESWSQDLQRAHAGKAAALAAAEEAQQEARAERDVMAALAERAAEALRASEERAESSRLALDAKLIIASQVERALGAEREAALRLEACLASQEGATAAVEAQRAALVDECNRQREQVLGLEAALDAVRNEASERAARWEATERERRALEQERAELAAANAAILVLLAEPPGATGRPVVRSPAGGADDESLAVVQSAQAAPAAGRGVPVGHPGGARAPFLILGFVRRGVSEARRNAARLWRWARRVTSRGSLSPGGP